MTDSDIIQYLKVGRDESYLTIQLEDFLLAPTLIKHLQHVGGDSHFKV